MKKAVMNSQFAVLKKAVETLGFKIINTFLYNNQRENPEATHADMQILRIEDQIVLLKGNDFFNSRIIEEVNEYKISFTEESIKVFKYPDCVKLNIALVGKKAIGNFKYADSNVIKILQEKSYDLINVKQGYAGCAVAVVSDDAIITADTSICRAVKGKIDCLKVSEGDIRLCERYGGFIGGASFLANKSTLAFMGDILKHPDYINIKNFCRNHRVELLSLSSQPLCDVGGVIVI